ncbi:MAG TPA: VWA domain-containing protein [Bryobacteraceae bacterium]|nr:VWA domain-containing protein [Bryobacteraceae bacterium]
MRLSASVSKLVVLGLACVALGAQDAPTFRTTTNLVIIDVTVRDKSGKAMDNLKKEDFTLLEDGKPQAISVFELQRLAGDTLPAVVQPEKTLIKRDASQPAAPVEHVTAPTKEQLHDKRLITLFFDFSSMQPAEQIRARAAATKFLSEQMTKSDLVQIMTFSTTLKIVENFTDDRELLLADIQKFRTGEGSDLAVDGTTGADDTDDSGEFTADETEFNIFNTDRKLSALEDAARKLALYPQKKALVYISSGVSKTGVENQSQLRATVNAAIRANVAFYPIDARGLMALVPGGDASTASPKGTGMFSGKTQSGIKDKFNDQQETLYTLAADTGGKALLDNNDLSVGMTQVQKDINTYYIVGYYSTNPAEDGKYRHVNIKLNPALQAKLDYKSGYFAAKTWQKFSSNDKERQLEEALTLGDPVNDLPLAVEIDYFRLAKDKYFVPISVKIPGSSILLAKKGEKGQTEFDFIGQINDPKGKQIGGVRDGVQVKLDSQNAEQLSHRQIEYDTALTLGPGDYRLHFLARENQTGKMGTFEAPFTVPNLDSDKATVRMSSVVWSNQKEPLSSSIGNAGTNKKLLEMHPLVDNGIKIVPSVTRVFRKDQNLYVYFEVYDPAKSEDAKVPSLTADLSLFIGRVKTFESSPVRVQKLNAKRPDVAAFQFQVPLAKMQPGKYVCQINVIDEQARKFAFSRAPLVLLP